MANAAWNGSEVFAAAVEQHAGSVVRVEGRHGPGSSGLAWSAEHVVTSSHALERDEGIEVGLADDTSVKATLVGRDPATDIAVLKLEGAKLTPAAFGELDGLKVGHWLLALGRPGKTVRATAGIVHALGPSWRVPHGGKLDRYVEADIGLFPGFSGGAVVDLSGTVLGMGTGGLMRRRALVVPTATLKRVVAQVLAHGHVQRGFLGVGVYPVRLPDAVAKASNQQTGALVVSVQPGSGAEKAGVVQGDVLIALDGSPVSHPGDLIAFLDEDRVGKTVSATIARAGQLQKVELAVGAR